MAIVGVTVLGTAFLAFRRVGRIRAGTAARQRSAGARAEEALIGLEKALETMQLGVTVTDTAGRILYSNPADARMHGYTPDELIGQHVRLFAPPSTAGKPLDKQKLADMRSWRRETINVRKDGSTFPVHLMSDVVRTVSGEMVGIVTTCEDITLRKRGEEALRESEERYALASHGANDGLWDWNLRTGEIFCSARWKGILGYRDHEMSVSGDEWFGRVHADDIDLLRSALAAHLEARSPHFEHQHRIKHKDGAYRWVLARGLAVRDQAGTAYRMAGSLTDVTERKAAEERLMHDALHDHLTGLPNRAFLLTMLDRTIKRTQRRRDYLFAVLFVDLDRFKLVNDSLGHNAGDQLLVAISQRLRSCLRPGDILARLGGDEFVIMLDDMRDVSDATRVAERVQSELNQPFDLQGHEVFTSASIGIALSTAGHELPEYVLRDADTAMYRAKSRGRARYEMFDEAIHARAVAQLRLETDLRRALEREEFIVRYQPIVELKSGRVMGFEALVRWMHPERGLIPPAGFISIAEETGLIVPIGVWVLRTACTQTVDWLKRFPQDAQLSISVNLSARHFQQPNLVQQILGVLKETGLPPANLKLEITESVLMDDPESHKGVIRELRAAGVQVQIDDFGSGYSSLSHLQRFSVDTLKIDGSFINSGEGTETWDIVQTIISLARDLGVNVIAEGVETEEQNQRLMALNCDHGQGFLFREAVDPESAEALLSRVSGGKSRS